MLTFISNRSELPIQIFADGPTAADWVVRALDGKIGAEEELHRVLI